MEKTTVMLAASAAMRAVEQEIATAAACSAKVLITGESGVGQELVARPWQLHRRLARQARAARRRPVRNDVHGRSGGDEPADAGCAAQVPGRRRDPAGRFRSSPAADVRQQRFDRLWTKGLSFWSEVHEPFMNRDLTRADVREIVQEGLAHTRGLYKHLVRAFNMPPGDYKRFLAFLKTHGCHVSFQSLRRLEQGSGGEVPLACA